MHLSLIHILMLLIACQGSLFSIQLWIGKTRRRISNIILSVFTLSISLQSLSAFLVEKGFIDDLTYGVGSGLLFGPILLLYARSLIFINFRFNRKAMAHLVVPAVGFICFSVLPALNLYSIPIGRIYVQVTIAVSLHFIFYVIVLYKDIRTYQRMLKDTFSNIEKINLSWLAYLVVSILILYVIVCIELFVLIDYDYYAIVTIYLYILFFVNGLYYNGLRQPEIFTGITYASETKPKYYYSDLTSEAIDNHLTQLLKFMNEDKPYLDFDLTLESLASRSNIPARAISQIINEKLGKTFFDFVNEYRVV